MVGTSIMKMPNYATFSHLGSHVLQFVSVGVSIFSTKICVGGDGRGIFRNVVLLSIFVHDVVNFLYYQH